MQCQGRLGSLVLPCPPSKAGFECVRATDAPMEGPRPMTARLLARSSLFIFWKSLYAKHAPEAVKDPEAPTHWNENILYMFVCICVSLGLVALAVGMPGNTKQLTAKTMVSKIPIPRISTSNAKRGDICEIH